MVLALESMARGDIERLGVKWLEESPYMEMKVKGLKDEGVSMYEAYIDYVTALKNCIDQDMPKLLDRTAKLPLLAEDAKDDAENELDSLDLLNKGRAI